MARLRRVTALLVAVLLLELLLVGSGYACVMPEPGDERAAGSVAATATTPPPPTDDCADAMAGAMAGAGAPTERDAPAPDAPSCPLPWAPAGCHAVPCAPAALASTPAHAALAPTGAAERLPLAVLAPASVARAPELPPPRA